MREKMKLLCNKMQAKTIAASTAMMAALPAIALAETGDLKSGGDGGAKDKVTAVLDMVVNIFPLIGGFFIVAGGFKLIMAYRNDQPEAQTAAAKDLVIGIIFVLFRVFAWPTLKGIM